MQDLGSIAGPSNSLSGSGIALSDWYDVGGGETGYTVPDPTDPDIVYAGEYAGVITRYDHRTRQARMVGGYVDNPSGHGAADMKYRFRWPAPIAGSPHDPKVIYHARQRPLPDRRRRPDLDADQPRPDPQRQAQAAVVRRPDHRRQHDGRVLLHDLGGRRIAQGERA